MGPMGPPWVLRGGPWVPKGPPRVLRGGQWVPKAPWVPKGPPRASGGAHPWGSQWAPPGIPIGETPPGIPIGAPLHKKSKNTQKTFTYTINIHGAHGAPWAPI